MWSKWWSLLVSLVIVILTTSVIFIEAGCLQEPKLCCEGKNNTCRREGPRVTNNDSFTCFCDAVCNQLGDCCVDYRTACQAVDCVLVDDWSNWSHCDVTCGGGFRSRHRKIVQEALNGGKDCDHMMERMPCNAGSCQTHYNNEGHEENSYEMDIDDMGLAKIIPVGVEESTLSTAAELLYQDQNLLPTSSSLQSSSSAGFRRHHSRHNEYDDSHNYDDDDDDGDGRKVNSERTQKILTIQRHDKTYFALFALTDVRPACHLSTAWRQHMTKGAKVCVDCRSLSIRRQLGNHCKGHGMTSRETRWVALTIPVCHGKWNLTKSHVTGSCRDAGYNLDFLFA